MFRGMASREPPFLRISLGWSFEFTLTKEDRTMDMELLPRGTIARFFAPGEDPLKAHAVRVKGSLCLEPDCGDSTRSPKRQHGWTCVADDPSAPLGQAPRHL